MTDKTDDKNNKDNVIQLPGIGTKPANEHNNDVTVPVTETDDNVIDFGETIREKEREDVEAYKTQSKQDQKEMGELRRKLGMMVSINEMLKIQLSDLITQLDFMDQHIKITTQNAKNMLKKLPKITTMDLPLPPEDS